MQPRVETVTARLVVVVGRRQETLNRKEYEPKTKPIYVSKTTVNNLRKRTSNNGNEPTDNTITQKLS